jgi:hypothetical protein
MSHLIEFAVHWARGTPNLQASIVASVAFTTLSVLFNLFVMRRGILIVDKGSPGLAADLRAIPRAILDFLAWGPLALRDVAVRHRR